MTTGSIQHTNVEDDDEASPLFYSTDITASAEKTRVDVIVKPQKRLPLVTVEPVIFFMMLCYGLFIPLRLQYLTMRIAKQDFNISEYKGADDPLCVHSNISNNMTSVNMTVEHKIQQSVTLWSLYFSAATSIPALFTTTILGAHSDQVGRRIALIVPSIGFCLYAICYLVVTICKLNLWYLLIGHIALGICGDFSLLLAGCFSYMADITTKKQRAFRIIILDCLSFTAAGIAQIGVGYLLKFKGFTAPYIFILACVALTTLYVIFVVPDSLPRMQTSWIHAKDVGKKILKLVQSNTHNRRMTLLIATVILVLRVLVFFSLPSLTLLYGMGSPFCWDSVIVGIFSAAQYITGALGMMVGGKLLGRYLRDASIVQVGLISSILCIILTGAAPSNVYLYLVPAVGLFRALSLPMLRTILSKLVYPSEQGVMFACIGCLQSAAMVVSPIVFNTIYYTTLSILPGLVFYIMSAFLAVACLLTIILQVRRQESTFLLLRDPLVETTGRDQATTRQRRNYEAVNASDDRQQ